VLALYDERLDAAYGDYFKVARGFVRLISEPKILQACVGLGLRVPPLMRELLAIMANLMSNDAKGPAEIGLSRDVAARERAARQGLGPGLR
jgi:hypothetical protein